SQTDDLPSDSEVTVRMKTIRSRTETIHLLDRELEDAADEIKAIHVTPIVTRFPEQKLADGQEITDREEENEEDTTEMTTTKRRKGLGRKKQKKEEAERRRKMMESTDAPRSSPTSEHTKSPRHLLTSRPTTPAPTSAHRSSFVHGAIDPLDPKFTNKGEIRAYPAQVASRRPKGSGRKKGNKTAKSNLSKDISMLWMMNESMTSILQDLPTTTPIYLPPLTSSATIRPPKPAIHTITVPTRSVITDELLPATTSVTVPLDVVETAYDLWRQSIDKAATNEGVTERRKNEEEKRR
ncbi:hypothetical protein PFISCL1PPCAC_21694, partial [Pristionchus fissidentatus]